MIKTIAKNKKVLLSFIGSNDAGILIDKSDGAILTALKNESFDEVILLWNENTSFKVSYSKITDYLKKEIKNRKLAKKIIDKKLKITNVTDHNLIFKKLLANSSPRICPSTNCAKES